MSDINYEREQQVEELFDAGLSGREIARRLGCAKTNIQRYLSRIKIRRAGKQTAFPPIPAVPDGFHLSGLSSTINAEGKVTSQSYRAKSGDGGDVVPENGAFSAPDGMFVRSVSTLIDGETGTVRQQWVKADIVKENEFKARVEAAVRAAMEKLEPLAPIDGPSATDVNSELATLYTLTDSHVGMLAWPRETGEPWDLKIAERVLSETLIKMIDSAPHSAAGIINQLGDFLHFDSLKAITPEHGNLLDADSRFQKIVEVAVRILRRVIEHALTRHLIVYVFMHEGNHDPASSVWLRVIFSALYENNPRVVVERSPLPYVAFQWGETMLGFHHGHLTKNESLPLLFAARFSAMWGLTKKRYIHVGHRHSVDEKEHPGVKVVQHSTLAAADAYAARSGYLSERQAVSMTYHKRFGEVARGIFVPVE